MLFVVHVFFLYYKDYSICLKKKNLYGSCVKKNKLFPFNMSRYIDAYRVEERIAFNLLFLIKVPFTFLSRRGFEERNTLMKDSRTDGIVVRVQ